MTIQNIVDEIISDVGGDTDDSDLVTKVFGFVKSALRRLPMRARSRSITSKKSVILAAAGQTVAIPSGFLQERAVWYEDSGKRNDIGVERDVRHFNLSYSSAAGYPEKCRIYGGLIEFNRPADKQYTVYIDCFVELDNIVISDTFGMDSSIAEIVKDGAKSTYYHEYVEDAEKGKEKILLFNDGLKKLDHKYQREELPDHVQESDDQGD